MTTRLLALAVLLPLFTVLAPAQDGGKETPKPAKKDRPAAPAPSKDVAGLPRVLLTPQDALDAYTAAILKDDRKAAYDCLAAVTLKKMAGSRAFNGLNETRSAIDGKSGGLDYTPMIKVLAKRGLTAEATKGVDFDARGVAQDKEKAKLADKIKDLSAFIIQFDDAQRTVLSGGKKPKPEPFSFKMTKVKIDGDKVTGDVVVSGGGKEMKAQFGFVKIGKGWKIVLPYAGR